MFWPFERAHKMAYRSSQGTWDLLLKASRALFDIVATILSIDIDDRLCYRKIQILCINQFQARTSPPRQTPGEFFWGGQKPCPGKNFPAKARPPGQKTPTPGEYFRRSRQPFLLTGIEILGFGRNQTLKRTVRLSNYSLVIPSSFSLSTIFKSFKVFLQLWNRFCN